MANTDGSVAFSIELDLDDVGKELERLKKRIIHAESELGEKNYKKLALEAQLEDVTNQLEKIRAKSKGGIISPDDSAAQELIAQNEKLNAELDKEEQSINNSNIALDAMKQRYADVLREAERLNNTSTPDDSGDEPQSSSSEHWANAKQAIAAVSKSIAVGLRKALSKGMQLVKLFGKGIVDAVEHLNVFSKITNKLGPSLSRLGNMVKQAFVFNVVTKWLQSLRSQIGELIGKNAELMEALGRLKGVFLTAFQPIYDFVMPALTSLINGITRALAVIAQFTASLFGKTAKEAQSSAKALNTESEALYGTGDAAEEATGSLAGFDEINTIQTEESKGGGGGGGTESGLPTFDYAFEDVDGEMIFDSWGAAFDAFLGKILDGIPKLETAFGNIAKNLNKNTKDILEVFTFPSVQDKVAELGRQVANALNNLVAAINWNQMGQALGAGLNTALLFLVNFIYTFDWISLGGSIASAINGAVSQIDWNAVGQLFWSGFKIAIETLAGILLGLDMPQLAQAASNLITGFFNSALETVNSIDWGAIGVQITNFLANVDWAGLFSSITGLTQGLIVGFTNLIRNVDFVSLASNILNGLLSVDWSSLFTSLGDLIGTTLTKVLDLLFSGEIWSKMFELAGKIIEGLLEGIVSALASIYDWIKEHIFQPIINAFKKIFGIHSPSTVMEEQGNLLAEGIMEGIKEKISSVVRVFKELWNKIKEVFSSVTNWFRDKFKSAWEAVKKVFSTGGKIFTGIKEGILNGLKAVINAIIKGINKVVAVPFDGINWALNKLRSISILGVKPFGWISTISVPQIPLLAQGAVIPPNREFLAVLGDQKSGTNVEAPLDTIKQALIEALRDNGGGNVSITVELDGEVLARKMVRRINDMTRRAGKPVLAY